MDILPSRETQSNTSNSLVFERFVQDLYCQSGTGYASNSERKIVDSRTNAEPGSNQAKSSDVELRDRFPHEQNRLVSRQSQTPTFAGDIRTRMMTPVPPEKVKTYEKIHRQIEEHQKFTNNMSYLGKVFDFVCQSDEESLDSLRQLQISPFTGDAKRFEERADDAIKNDLDGIETQVDVHRYGSSTLKAAALCLKGPDAVASVAGVFAVDQMRPEDPLPDQALDGVLGTAKGALTYWTFGEIAASSMPAVARSVGTGIAGRTLDNGLSRQNYYDQTGRFDRELGFRRTVATAFDPRSLSRDGVIVGTQDTMVGCLNFAVGPTLSRNPLLNTLATNTTRGASSGIVNEVLNETDKGRTPEVGTTLLKGGLQATLSNLAKLPSGLQSGSQNQSMLDRRIVFAPEPSRRNSQSDQ